MSKGRTPLRWRPCKSGKVKKWGKVKISGLVDKWTGGRGETNNSGRVDRGEAKGRG